MSTEIVWAPYIFTASTVLGLTGALLKYAIHVTAKRFEEKLAQHQEALKKLEDQDKQYLTAYEKIRDKWDEFLKEYMRMDATRGAKVDALFRVVDQMMETIKDLRGAMNTKIDESFLRSQNELKLYIRDQLREEFHEHSDPKRRT